MDTLDRSTSTESRSGQLNFSYFHGFVVFLCANLLPIQFGYSQTPEASPPAETKPTWHLERMVLAVQEGKIISYCSVSGSELAELLIQTKEVNGSASQLASGIRIERADIEDAVKITGGTVSVPVTFVNCVFKGEVNFVNAKFLHDLEISRSHFKGQFNADGMQVNGDFTVKGETEFEPANRVVFRNAQVQGDLNWTDAHFLSEDVVDCERMSVSHNAFLSTVEFKGLADFQHCIFGHQLTIEGCKFEGANQAANFSSVTTQEDIRVSSSHFSGPAIWDYIHAEGLYFYNGTSFDRPLSFSNLILDRSMALVGVSASSDVSVKNSQISGDLNLNGLTIQISPEQGDQRRRPAFHLLQTKVIGYLKLAAVSMPGRLDLEEDNIGILDITNYATPPRDRNRWKLANLTVNTFQPAASEGPYWLDFLKSCEFDPQIYLSLEKFFTAQGEPGLANRTFIERNDRFEEVRPKDLSWLGQAIVGLLAGYGRAPERSLLPCAIVVLFGFFVFRDKDKMKVNDDKFQDRRYNAFWYSLDVFAPIIDLEAAKVWSPLPGQTFKWIVFRAERILGWLLVPIAIAAFTGFLHA